METTTPIINWFNTLADTIKQTKVFLNFLFPQIVNKISTLHTIKGITYFLMYF